MIYLSYLRSFTVEINIEILFSLLLKILAIFAVSISFKISSRICFLSPLFF